MSHSSHPARGITPPPVYDAPSTAQTSLRPYLQLPHLISLSWLAYPIISIVFVIFRLQISSSQTQDSVASAKGDLLAACYAAELAAAAAASLPRYLAIATNQQIADAVNSTMNGARAALILALTCMEAIINFLIDIYRSTFFCFLELVVFGGLDLLISAVKEITSFLQNTINSIVSGLKNDAATINSAIQSAVDAINKVNPFGNIQAPQFNLSSFDALGNITIPTDFENALVSLNNSLPTISSLKNSIQDLVDTPFEAVKTDINQTFFNLTWDSSLLPVPDKNNVSFCSNLDTSSIDNLGQDLLWITKIGTIVLVGVLLLLLAAQCALDWYKWRCLQWHLHFTREAWRSDASAQGPGISQEIPTMTLTNHNLLVLQADSHHPILTRIANNLSSLLGFSPSGQIHLRWFLHYVFHPPALACFMIGFFGLLSVEIQLIAVAPLEAKFSAQANATVQDLSNSINAQVNSSMYNQSATYAGQINSKVDVVQSTINNGLFGWVNGTTTTLNDTLNTFYTDVQNLVTSVFNGTILESPVQSFVMCMIGSKVSAIEEALTFLNENLQVDIPRVNNSVLVLSPNNINEVTQPIATAAVGGGQNNSTGIIGKLVDSYVSSLKKERLMFSIFMGLWGVVVLMGLSVIFWHSCIRPRIEARRRRRWKKEQRDALEGFSPPYYEGSSKNVQDVEKSQAPPLRSFTPLSEPRSPFSFNPFRRSTQPPANHPLNSLEPRFEKSWDSFFCEGEGGTQQQQSPPSGATDAVTKPTTSMSLGKKPSDEGKPEQHVPADKPKTRWFNSYLSKMSQASPPPEELTADPASRAARLNLTIATDRSASPKSDTLPKIEVSPTLAEPSSAWSVTPPPPLTTAHSWIKGISRLKSPHLFSPPPPVPPVLPLAKRKHANVPTDVGLTYPGNVPSPLAMPLHNGFERRASVIQSSPSTPHNLLTPPKVTYGRSRPLPPVASPPHGDSDGVTNPFATPFDDHPPAAI